MIPCSVVLYTLLVLTLVVFAKKLLSNKPNAVKYYFKLYSYFGITLLISGLCIPFLAIRPKDIKNLGRISSFLNLPSRIIGIKCEMRNKEILAVNRGCIAVANHQTVFDSVVCFRCMTIMKKTLVIIKKEIFYIWPLGLLFYLCGAVFVNRKNTSESYRLLNIAKDIMVKEKSKLCVFPEGTRNDQKPGILPFKKGGFIMALEAKVPIIPIVISPQYFFNPQKKLLDGGTIIATCLEPIETKDLSMDDIDDLMERTRNAMIDCYNSVKDEILSTLPANYPLAERLKVS